MFDNLKGAIFDVDGTLIDSMPTWTAVGEKFLSAHGLDVPENIVDVLKYTTLVGSAKYFKEKFKIALSEEQVFEELKKIVIDLYSNVVPLKPGVAEFIKKLHDNGTKLVVATANERVPVESSLKHNGILKYFDKVIICDEVHLNKKQVEFFDYVADVMNLPASEIVVFEDAFHAIETAKIAGFKVAAIKEESFYEERESIMSIADWYFDSFEECIT